MIPTPSEAPPALALAQSLADTQRLATTLTAILETMFFFSPEEIWSGGGPSGGGQSGGGPSGSGPSPFLAASEPCDTAVVEFEGPLRGRLALRSPRAVSAVLAADFHGESPSAEDVGAVVLELTNIVCGNLLSQLHAAEVFCLGAPLRWPEAGFEAAEAPQVAVRGADGWIAAWLQVSP